MSLVPTSTRTQEEYEDDFEKDLDWLISEEGTNDGQVGQCGLADQGGQVERRPGKSVGIS